MRQRLRQGSEFHEKSRDAGCQEGVRERDLYCYLNSASTGRQVGAKQLTELRGAKQPPITCRVTWRSALSNGKYCLALPWPAYLYSETKTAVPDALSRLPMIIERATYENRPGNRDFTDGSKLVVATT
ncbi:hypothetical protein BHM03_00031306 [Ensete ventricosum]|nr:hypothetical protein BHM03_00031306 [Ensete ventricosum]